MRPIAIFWIYASLSLFLVFYIPTLVPVKLNSSESYFFGYNNRAGFLLFVPLMAVASLWWRSFRLTSLSESPSIAVSVWQLWKAWAIGLTACGFMYWLTARYGGYRDSSYLIDRIELASRGLFPYRDFEFSYGAALIYLPLWISRIFRLSIPNAYYFFWLLSVLAGIWMLRQVINRIDCPSREKGNVFVLLYLAMLPGILSTGTNYTGVRFLSGPLFALIVYDAIRNRSVKSQIVGSLQAIAFCAALLLVSPESAIAFCAGISAFFFFFYIPTNTQWFIPTNKVDLNLNLKSCPTQYVYSIIAFFFFFYISYPCL